MMRVIRIGMKFFRAALIASMVVSPIAAWAQGHGHAHAPANGGQVQMIGPYEAELVVKGGEMMLYVVDEKDEKVDATKFSARAVVLAKGNEQKTVELKPAKDNMLSGRADFAVDGKFRATVTLRSGSTEIGKGRYNIDLISR